MSAQVARFSAWRHCFKYAAATSLLLSAGALHGAAGRPSLPAGASLEGGSSEGTEGDAEPAHPASVAAASAKRTGSREKRIEQGAKKRAVKKTPLPPPAGTAASLREAPLRPAAGSPLQRRAPVGGSFVCPSPATARLAREMHAQVPYISE